VQANGRADAPESSQAAAYVAQARRRRADGDLDGAIEAYEQALNAEAELATVRQLAELFAMRGGPGDAQQAADLYCTLGDVLGNPEGIGMLEKALAQRPEHAAARALLDTYTGKKAKSAGVLDSPSARGVLDSPSARGVLDSPSARGVLDSPSARGVLDSPSARRALQARVEAAPPPRVAAPRELGKGPPPLGAAVFALPSGAPGAAVSSLTPVVRQDAEVELPEARARPMLRWAVLGLAATGVAAAAAFAVFQSRMAVTSGAARSAASSYASAASEPGASTTPTVLPSAASGAATATTPSAANTANANAANTMPGANVAPAANVAPSVDTAPSANPAPSANTAPSANPAPSANAAPAAKDTTGAAHGSALPGVADVPLATAKDQAESADAPAKSAGSKSTVQALLEVAKLSGGKLNAVQLSAALDKANPKLERCYAQLLKKKPRAKGRLTFSWTVRLDGRVSALKKVGDTLNDGALGQCTQQAIADTRFPKPRKQAAQIKLAFDYRRPAGDK
jgi:hypothetical protein